MFITNKKKVCEFWKISRVVPILTGRLDKTKAVDWSFKPQSTRGTTMKIFQVFRLYDYLSLAVLPVQFR